MTMSRLTIDMTEQQHQALKATAALQGKSIKAYAIERLFPLAADEGQVLDELRALLSERLAEAQRGELIMGRITDVAGEVLASGGPN
jgi:Antitoxin ParD